MAKKVLKTKRNTAAQIAAPELLAEILALPAKMAMDPAIPAAPNNIKGRRPIFSMTNTAIQLAKKYSVPLQAAKIRESVGVRPMYCIHGQLHLERLLRKPAYRFIDCGCIVSAVEKKRVVVSL